MFKVNTWKLLHEQGAYFWTYLTFCSSVSIVNFEQINAGWEIDVTLVTDKRHCLNFDYCHPLGDEGRCYVKHLVWNTF